MIGPAQKVLRDLAVTINQTETGAVSLVWHTAHGRRVVEINQPQPLSGEAVQIGSEPVDYVALGLPTNATPAEVAEATAPAKPAGNAVARAFADAWHILFPPKQGGES